MKKAAQIILFPIQQMVARKIPARRLWDTRNVIDLDDVRWEREEAHDALHLLGFGNRAECIA